VHSTSSEQAINPVEPPGEPTLPVRQVVRLDAEYLGTGARSKPAQDASEPEEEQLIVLPRRSGSLLARWFARLFG
jgi:hypothetical protein